MLELAVCFSLDMGREQRELRARRDWDETGCVSHEDRAEKRLRVSRTFARSRSETIATL